MSKIVITGGLGYLGSKLAKELIKCGHEIYLYDSLIYEQSIERMLKEIGTVNLEIGDTRNYPNLKRLLENFKPDFVFHFAELSSTYSCNHNPRHTEDINFIGSSSVIALCESLKIPVIYNSTSSVYSGEDNYTKYKLKMEEYCKGKNVMIFRPATVFGLSPRFRIELLPNHFTYMAVSKGHITVSGGGNYRAAIDIDDLISAYLRVIEVGKWKQQIYDIGHFNMTKDEFAEGVKEVVPCYIKTSDKIFDTRNLKIDCSLFEEEFNWKPSISFKESITKIASWIRENQAEIESTNFSEMLNMPLDMWKSICQ